MTARDGQSLAGQDAATQAMFQAVWGDKASQQWDMEHNAQIGASDAGGGGGSGNWNGGGGAGTGGGGGGNWNGGGGGGTPGWLNALSNFGAQASGVTQAELAERKRQFDLQLDWAKQMWQQQGLPQLIIQQREMALREQEYQSQLELARQSMALQQAGLLGYYMPSGQAGAGPQGAVPGAQAGTWQAPTQDQYVQARTQQLMQHGFDQTRAQQTAVAEWAQGLAQSGNVALGLPQGISFTPPPPGQAVAGVVQGPTQDQYVQARAQQLVKLAGFDQTRAQQTAVAEWAQNLPQKGNIPFGLPQGITFNAPAQNAQNAQLGTNLSGFPAGAIPTLAGRQAEAAALGLWNGQPTLQAQQQIFGQRMALANQGMDYLKTAAALQGPENVFQQSNFYRGAQNNPDVPVFLQSLLQNVKMPAFQAQGTPANPLTMATLARGLTGYGNNPGFNVNSSLDAIRGISNRGAQGLAPGTLERLTPEELQALGSGLGAIGNTLPAFLQAYQRSRPDQTAMSGDMSLAA